MLVVDNLVKRYGSISVLKGVSLTVGSGEVLALLGANGAGKSTLISCLSGATHPDAGEIVINGSTYPGLSPRTAHAAGVAVIYQHLSLVPSLTVMDNIFLGDELVRRGVIDRARQQRQATELLARLGVELALDAPVSALSTGQRQLVEIAKALRLEPQILILDEPTAALGLSEAEALMKVVRNLAAAGLAIVYVTHLLEEVARVAARVVVLRDGKIVFEQGADVVSDTELVQAISPGSQSVARDRGRDAEGRPIVLQCSGFAGPGFGPVDLAIRQGEVVALFGMLGSGRSELLETLYGARRSKAGLVAINGARYQRRDPTRSARRGLHLVPSDRAEQGLFATLRCDENVLIPQLKRLGRFFRRPDREQRTYREVAAQLDVRPSQAGLAAGSLSGGNQQKLMVARYAHDASSPTVLMLDEPTQGVDIGARRDLYRHLRNLAEAGGVAVLFSSSDPEEVLELADRALVLHRGVIVDELAGQGLSHEALVAAAHRGVLQEVS